MKVCIIIYNYKSMFELTSSLGVQSEIGLKRDLQMDSLRHVDEGAAGCLYPVMREMFNQETEKMKFFRWLAHGYGTSYEDFWQVNNNG